MRPVKLKKPVWQSWQGETEKRKMAPYGVSVETTEENEATTQLWTVTGCCTKLRLYI